MVCAILSSLIHCLAILTTLFGIVIFDKHFSSENSKESPNIAITLFGITYSFLLFPTGYSANSKLSPFFLNNTPSTLAYFLFFLSTFIFCRFSQFVIKLPAIAPA